MRSSAARDTFNCLLTQEQHTDDENKVGKEGTNSLQVVHLLQSIKEHTEERRRRKGADIVLTNLFTGIWTFAGVVETNNLESK